MDEVDGERPLRPRLDEGTLWYADETSGVRLVVSQRLGPKQRARLATTFDVALFAHADGTRTITTIAEALGTTPGHVREAIAAWEARAPGIFLWIASREDEARRDRLRAAALDLLDERRAATEPTSSNVPFHATGGHDAWSQFEDDETTVSHAYRLPHPALAGRTYGEAFCDQLLARGAFEGDGALSVLEIGGGTGLFAKALLDRLARSRPDAYARVRYQVLDLSPSLQASQREVCRDHAHVMELTSGDVEEADPTGADRGFALVIANEMIADLSIDVAKRSHLERGAAENEGERLMLDHGLDFARMPSAFAINTGAIRLCEKLARWLSPGGLAVVTEYGSRSLPPRAVDLPGHREHSIRFDHLVAVAERRGLHAELLDLGRFLGFDPAHETIGFRTAQMLFEQLLPLLGVAPPPFIAHDAPSLKAALGPLSDRIGNLRFHAQEGPGALLSPFSFQALVLRAPAAR